MTTPYGLRIVWEFLNQISYVNDSSFHCQLSYMDGREEETDPASEQHWISR